MNDFYFTLSLFISRADSCLGPESIGDSLENNNILLTTFLEGKERH